jgi:hypothetical protein
LLSALRALLHLRREVRIIQRVFTSSTTKFRCRFLPPYTANRQKRIPGIAKIQSATHFDFLLAPLRVPQNSKTLRVLNYWLRGQDLNL